MCKADIGQYEKRQTDVRRQIRSNRIRIEGNEEKSTYSVLHCMEPCNNKRSTSSVGSMFTMSSRYVQVKYNLISM
ncbi:hypothetical protein NQ318_006751 [Aromia moschata]|uniref:Uncharacterized protein n=1 Tax=Aromia moschata TaxID=1265417 RepID=A0AAV8Y6U8_9CUCU|nr:hypothetical protein NQ318_006751 [Aromia moschata]